MRKKLTVLLLCMTLLLSVFAGCAKQKQPNDTDASSTTTAEPNTSATPTTPPGTTTESTTAPETTTPWEKPPLSGWDASKLEPSQYGDDDWSDCVKLYLKNDVITAEEPWLKYHVEATGISEYHIYRNANDTSDSSYFHSENYKLEVLLDGIWYIVPFAPDYSYPKDTYYHDNYYLTSFGGYHNIFLIEELKKLKIHRTYPCNPIKDCGALPAGQYRLAKEFGLYDYDYYHNPYERTYIPYADAHKEYAVVEFSVGEPLDWTDYEETFDWYEYYKTETADMEVDYLLYWSECFIEKKFDSKILGTCYNYDWVYSDRQKILLYGTTEPDVKLAKVTWVYSTSSWGGGPTFYEDEYCYYWFDVVATDGDIVFEDGTKMSVSEAFYKELITCRDLILNNMPRFTVQLNKEV